jgi:hypothetical protein
MTVTLDVDRTWRVECDGDCSKRLYVTGDTASIAAVRATKEYPGWQIEGEPGEEKRIYCPTHRSPR